MEHSEDPSKPLRRSTRFETLGPRNPARPPGLRACVGILGTYRYGCARPGEKGCRRMGERIGHSSDCHRPSIASGLADWPLKCFSDKARAAAHPGVKSVSSLRRGTLYLGCRAAGVEADRGNYFAPEAGMMSCSSTPLQSPKWGGGRIPLFPRNHKNTKPMSQSTSSPGEMSPSAPADPTYPPQLHAGAVGLGPEYGKGAVRIHYSISR